MVESILIVYVALLVGRLVVEWVVFLKVEWNDSLKKSLKLVLLVDLVCFSICYFIYTTGRDNFIVALWVCLVSAILNISIRLWVLKKVTDVN